jgi:hypothetical protein
MTLHERLEQIAKDLRGLASEMIAGGESDSAIALLQAERAVAHANDVMADNFDTQVTVLLDDS